MNFTAISLDFTRFHSISPILMDEHLDRGKLRLALDIGLRTVSREECEAFFASGAIRQVFLDASKHSFAVVARFAQTAGHVQDEVGGGVAAMALATVRQDEKTMQWRCTIFGLKVVEAMRRTGMGERLFMALHARAFEIAQSCAARRAPGVAPGDVLEYDLSAGHCRRTPEACLIFAKHGATITQAEGAAVLSEAELRDACGADWTHAGVHVAFPSVRLAAPYSEPSHAALLEPTWLPPRPDPAQEFGMDPYIAKSLPNNYRLLLFWPLDLLEDFVPSRRTGLHPFVQCARPCGQVLEYVLSHRSDDEKTLYLSHLAQHGPKIFGYRGYKLVNAPELDSDLQERRTKMAKGSDLLKAMDVIPGLPQLTKRAMAVLGLPFDKWRTHLRAIHFLEIDAEQQAGFSWHTDETEELHLSTEEVGGLRTVVTQLSAGEKSAMCMWGFAPHVYRGRGDAVVFHGSAVHGSMRWPTSSLRRTVWKLTHVFVLADSTKRQRGH